MEELLVQALLWKFGFVSDIRYSEILDKMFLENPESIFLLDLEECSSNCDATYEIISRFLVYEYNLDIERFGKGLFSGLEAVYTEGLLAIKDFGEKCYALWNSLPVQVREIEPFLRYVMLMIVYPMEMKNRQDTYMKRLLHFGGSNVDDFRKSRQICNYYGSSQ